jgi:peptide deformylase
MGYREIVKNGEPLLRKTSRKVEKFDEKLARLIDDMKETMYRNEGVGLAAVQVGVLRRVVVLDCGDGFIEMVNPEIISAEGEQEAQEGCLSLPGEFGVTKRPAEVKVQAQDRTGKWHIYKGTELKARCFCHEIDHLNGILFTQKVIRKE